MTETTLRFSDVLYDRIYAERKDVPFYVDVARRYPGPLLEAACGTGRVLIPSACAGATIVGFDISEARLALCRTKLAAELAEVQTRASVFSGNMLHCDFGSDFGVVTMPFRGFQDLITIEEERMALVNLHRHLRVGGQLVLDVFNPSIPFLADSNALNEFVDSVITAEEEGVEIRLAYRILARDYFRQLQHVEEIIYVDGPGDRHERQVRQFTTRYIFKNELEYLLNLTGFEVKHVYGDYDRTPFGEEYPGEIIVVAEKSGH